LSHRSIDRQVVVKFRPFGLGVLVAALALAGCGDSTAKIEKTVLAAGVLTHRGQPLAYYQVMFTPDDGRRPAAGTTDEQGKFVLGTNKEGDGAVPGSHHVSVIYMGPPGASGDGMNSFTRPPPPKIKITAKYGNAETSGLTQEIPPSGSSDLKIDLP
jgi:hypothetical protein